ncbi:hypothetical protein [Heyndrickxia sporothermodurans]
MIKGILLALALTGIPQGAEAMPPSPGAVEVRPKLRDVEQISEMLAVHGVIYRKGTEKVALPQGLPPAVIKAAQILKAIGDAERRGVLLRKPETIPTNAIAERRGLQAVGATYDGSVSFWSPDGKILIGEHVTTWRVDKGRTARLHDGETGLRETLSLLVRDLHAPSRDRVNAYIFQDWNGAE